MQSEPVDPALHLSGVNGGTLPSDPSPGHELVITSNAELNADAQLTSSASPSVHAPITSPVASVQSLSTDQVASVPAPEPMHLHKGAIQIVLLVAFGLDTLLYSLVVPFLPTTVQAAGASPSITGALFASYAAGLLLFTPVAGWFTDRLGARTTLLVGLSSMFLATLLFAFVQLVPALFVARTAQGCAGAMTWTAGLALVSQLYDGETRLAVFARVFAATGIGTSLGPPLGGVLYGVGGFRTPFIAAACLVLADGLGRLLFLPSRRALKAGTGTLVDEVSPRPSQSARSPRAPSLLTKRPSVFLGLFGTAIGGVVLALLEPSLPPLLIGRFGFHAAEVGALFAALTAVFLAVQPLVVDLLRRAGGTKVLSLGLAVDTVGLLALSAGIGSALLIAIMGLALIAAGTALSLIAAFSLLEGRRIPVHDTGPDTVVQPVDSNRGKLYAAYNLSYAIGILIGPLGIGLLTARFGPSRALFLMGVIPLLACVMVLTLPKSRLAVGEEGET